MHLHFKCYPFSWFLLPSPRPSLSPPASVRVLPVPPHHLRLGLELKQVRNISQEEEGDNYWSVNIYMSKWMGLGFFVCFLVFGFFFCWCCFRLLEIGFLSVALDVQELIL